MINGYTFEEALERYFLTIEKYKNGGWIDHLGIIRPIGDKLLG